MTRNWFLSEGSPQGVVLVVGLSRGRRGGVEAPFGQERLWHLAWLRELEHAGLLWHNCALMLWTQPWHQLCHESAGLLRVEVTHLLWHVDQGGNGLIMALLRALLKGAPCSTDLNRKLFTAGVPDKLAGLLLHILGGAGGLVHRPALLGPLTVANLLCRPVALPHRLVEGLLLERDLARLLKVLLAHLLLAGLELGDVGVVALLGVLVGALQDRLLLNGGHLLLPLNTAESSLRVGLASAEVDPTLDSPVLLSSTPGESILLDLVFVHMA